MKFKSILRIIIGIVVLVIFIGTIYYLYAKSQKKPVTYKTESPFVTNIFKKTVARFGYTAKGNCHQEQRYRVLWKNCMLLQVIILKTEK